MSAGSTRYFIVHSPNGRILAAAPVEPKRPQSGVHLRWKPVTGPNHVISEVEVTAEHAALLATSALLEFEVEVQQNETPRLRRRSRT
jgi:hypothetical protein